MGNTMATYDYEAKLPTVVRLVNKFGVQCEFSQQRELDNVKFKANAVFLPLKKKDRVDTAIETQRMECLIDPIGIRFAPDVGTVITKLTDNAYDRDEWRIIEIDEIKPGPIIMLYRAIIEK